MAFLGVDLIHSRAWDTLAPPANWSKVQRKGPIRRRETEPTPAESSSGGRKFSRRSLIIGASALGVGTVASYTLYKLLDKDEVPQGPRVIQDPITNQPTTSLKESREERIRRYFVGLAQEWENSTDPKWGEKLRRWSPILRDASQQLVFDIPETVKAPMGVTPLQGRDGSYVINAATGFVQFTFRVNRNIAPQLFLMETTADEAARVKLKILFDSIIVKEFTGLEYITSHRYIGRTRLIMKQWLAEQAKIPENERYFNTLKLATFSQGIPSQYARIARISKIFAASKFNLESVGYIGMIDYWYDHGMTPEFLSRLDPIPSTWIEMFRKAGPTEKDRLWRIGLLHIRPIFVELNNPLLRQLIPEQVLAVYLILPIEVAGGNVEIGQDGISRIKRDSSTGLPLPQFMDYLREPDYYEARKEILEKELGEKRGYRRERLIEGFALLPPEEEEFLLNLITGISLSPLANSEQPLESCL